jgi:hypothetical protein
MKKSRLLGAVCACIFTFITTATYAATIDFEGVLSDGQGRTGSDVTPYTEDGFTVTSSGSSDFGRNDIFGDGFSWNDNGSDFFGWCGNCTNAPFTLTLVGGGPFSLSSIDFSNMTIGSDVGTINITGFFSGGGSTTQTFDPTVDVWTTAAFTGFEDLSSLTIAAATIGANLAMDNIVVTAVPVPAAIWLFGSGLLGLIGIARIKAA